MTIPNIATNLHGRLRNTSLPYANGLLPVFEAVANAIHAIEDAGLPMEQGQIFVEIERVEQARLDFQPGQKKRGAESKDNIKSFMVTDNGVGFTDENMDSFHTLDSEYKAARGGRGVGRLLWLKAFRRASIKSTYIDSEGNYQFREFMFRTSDGITEHKPKKIDKKQRSTSIHLEGFNEKYRKASPKTAKVVAHRLLEHCLWYFVRSGGAPRIIVIDGDERISLDEVYDTQMVAAASPETIEIKNVKFELVHIKGTLNNKYFDNR